MQIADYADNRRKRSGEGGDKPGRGEFS